MPRATFATSALDGMTPGLSKLAQAIAGGDQAYQAGYENAGLYQSRMAQALAQVKQSNASADHYGAQAELERGKQRTLDRRPGLFEEQTANLAGVDIPTVQAYRQQLSTGQAPQVPMGPEAPDGSMGQGSFVLPAATKTKLAGALQQFLPLLANSGDLKPDDLSKAAGDFRTMSLSDAIIAGRADRNTVGGAQAAAAGKDLFKTDTTGAVLDQFTGGLNTTNPMAQSTISLRGAQAGQAKAAAADHYAGAGLKKAQRDEVTNGPKGQVVQTEAGPMLVDPRNGRASAIVGPDGRQVAGKAGSLNGEQANALTFASRMAASDKILGELAKKGVDQSGWLKRSAEAMPVIGQGLGTFANFTQSSGQQQVEQAQRDFVNAVLRRESGAAIGADEFANASRQYFVQPGDSNAVISQKAAARQRVIQGMLAAVPANMRVLPDMPGAIEVDY